MLQFYRYRLKIQWRRRPTAQLNKPRRPKGQRGIARGIVRLRVESHAETARHLHRRLPTERGLILPDIARNARRRCLGNRALAGLRRSMDDRPLHGRLSERSAPTPQAAKQGLRKAAKIRSLRVDHRADIPVAHSELSALATVSTLAHSPAHFNSDALPRSKYLISRFHQAVRLYSSLIFASRVCVPQYPRTTGRFPRRLSGDALRRRGGLQLS